MCTFQLTDADQEIIDQALIDFKVIRSVFAEITNAVTTSFTFHLAAGGRIEFRTLFAIRLIQNLYSIDAILEPRQIETSCQVVHFIDFPAAFVLVRSALESFITFAYIHNTDDDSLAEFRHATWVCSGMLERQKFKIKAPELDIERAEIDRLLSFIKNDLRHYDSHFEYFDKRDNQKKFYKLKEKGWRLDKTWVELGQSAGFNSHWIADTYKFLCSHAHSDYVGFSQISGAKFGLEDQRILANASVTILLQIVVHFICIFVKLERDAANAIQKISGAVELINFYKTTDEEMKVIHEKLNEIASAAKMPQAN